MKLDFFHQQKGRLYSIGLTLIFLAFPALCRAQTLQQVFPLLRSERTTTYIPDLNRQARSELGDTMLESFWTVSGKRLGVLEEANCNIRGLPGTFHIPKNSELFQIQDDKSGFFFRSNSLLLSVSGGPRLKSTNDKVNIFVSKTPPHHARLVHTHLFGTEESNCNILVGYVDFKIHGLDELKKQLIYTGISRGVISLTYREFMNDMARPAFTQDLKFDLAEGKTIGFKGLGLIS